MSIIKKFILTSRYHKPHGILLLFFPCIWGMCLNEFIIPENLFFSVIFLVGACGMRSLGCIWNDFNDKHFDIKIYRTKNRLIASKNINNYEILLFSIINGVIGCIPLFFLSTLSILISISVIPLIIIYPFMKRYTWWPQLWLGISFNWGILVGYSVNNGSLLQMELLLFYLGGIFFTIGYDTIYGFQDLKGDQIVGIKSTSLKFKNNPKIFLFFIYLFAFIFWSFSLFLVNKSILTILFFLIPCILILLKVLTTNIEIAKECEKTFTLNSYFSFFIMIILILL